MVIVESNGGGQIIDTGIRFERDIEPEPEPEPEPVLRPVFLGSPFFTYEPEPEIKPEIKQLTAVELTSPFLLPKIYGEAIASGSEDLMSLTLAEQLARESLVQDIVDEELVADLYQEFTGKELTEAEKQRLNLLELKGKIIVFLKGIKRFAIPIGIIGVIATGLIGYQYSKSYVSEKGAKKARGK